MLSGWRWALAGAWLAALLGLAVALEAPGRLFVNLGPGDAPFARGFRGSWERDGTGQAGATTFRWALDGSRLTVPLSVLSGRLEARLRLARFVDTPVDVRLRAGGRDVASWRQEPRGWTERSFDLGELRGPLQLQVRADGTDAEGLAVAIDWLEIRGVGRIWPATEVLAGMLALLVGVPVLLGLAVGRAAVASAAGAGLAAAGTLAVLLDRFGGLALLGSAGLPALLAVAALLLVARGLRAAWPRLLPASGQALPVAATLIALLALSHPFFYYPDVDTHARFLAELRAHPGFALDPAPYQLRVGAWTRELGGQRIAFPYSAAFHLLSWPPALLVGEVAAVKLVGALAVGFSLLLCHALAMALGLGASSARLAQLLFATLPVVASRLSLALYPALLGQALELLLVVVLTQRLSRLGARTDAAIVAALLAAQVGYTGSLLTVAALAALLAAWQALSAPRAGLRLAAAWGATWVVVVLAQYGRWLPTLVAEVLPNLTAPSGAALEAGTGHVAGAALARLLLFYGPVYPALAVLGLRFTPAASAEARRVVASALVAGLGLLALRYAAPAVFRDAKEIEWLAAPVAVLSAASLGALRRIGRWGRGAGPLLAAALLVWGCSRAAAAYAERFVAVGR